MTFPDSLDDKLIVDGFNLRTTQDYILDAVNDAEIHLTGEVRINGGRPLRFDDLPFVSLMDPQFNVVGDGTTDDTLAINNVLAASIGKTVVAPNRFFAISGEVIVPAKTNLIGTGGCWAAGVGVSNPGTVFKCTSANAKVIIDGSGGSCGGFNVDGQLIATGPLLYRRNLGAKRFIYSIGLIQSTVEAWRVDTCQNDIYLNIHLNEHDGIGLILDKGTGGNLFIGCELARCAGWALVIDETTGAGSYSSPTDNTFEHCLFELNRTGSPAKPGSVYIKTGKRNVFNDCAYNPVTAITEGIIKVDNTALGDDPIVIFNNAWIACSTAGQTGIIQEAGTVHLYGSIEFQSLLHGWKFGGGTVQTFGHIFYNSVTNRFDPAGAGDERLMFSTRQRPLFTQIESTDFFAHRVSQYGDTGARLDIGPGAIINFGSGTGATDTSLSRVATGVLATGTTNVFRPGIVATGSRPVAANVGQGCIIFDTTLKILIYSDGVIWRKVSDDTAA